MKKECIAMLLAGGQGSRLYVLTENMAKPAIPFGGKFRIIDFPLSNCANAGIDTVGVLTQYRPLELNRYIGSGQPWDLDRADGGVHILPPYQSANGASWYKGTANAIFQNIGFVDMYDPEYVLILSGDHIYKMNYAKMLDQHKKTGADCTISVMEVPWEDAPRFGIMNVDGTDTVTEFEEKPAQPKSNLASMGIYIFTWKKLRAYLIEDEGDETSSNDFGKNIIPKMLQNGEKMSAYRFSGYWKDVGTLDSLWDANMDMLATGSGLDPLQMAQMREVIRRAGQDSTVLLSSHLLSEVTNVCGRAIVLDEGVIRYDGTMDALLRGAASLRLMYRGDAAMMMLIRELPGVTEVTEQDCREDGCHLLLIRHEMDADLRAQVSALCYENHCALLEETNGSDALEDAFLHVIARKDISRKEVE